MTRTIAASLLLAAAALAGALAYHAAARDRDYRGHLSRGDAALAGDQPFGAIEAYSGALALKPESMLAHLRRGEAYEVRNDLEAATRDFRMAADLDPSAPRPLEALGDVLYRRGRFGAAAEAYERRIALDSPAPRIAYKLALARYREGNLDAALSAAAEAVRLDAGFAEAHYVIGLCLRERQRIAEAVAALEKAAALSPGLIPAREELADLYARLGRGADEIEQLQFIAMLDRTRAERQVAVGLAQARAGQREAAVLTLGHALDRTPDHPLIYGALGQVWLARAVARGDQVFLRKAIEALERAASIGSASSEVLAAYGRALLLDGQPEAGARALQMAVDRSPVAPAALLLYAEVAERHGQVEEARQAIIRYDALVADNPDLAQQAAVVARLSLQVQDVATAAAWIERGLRRDPDNVALHALAAAIQ